MNDKSLMMKTVGLLLSFTLLLVFFSCGKTVNRASKASPRTHPGNGGYPPPSGYTNNGWNDPGEVPDGSTPPRGSNYYSITGITAHGHGNAQRPNPVRWSSDVHSGFNRSIFDTDSRLNVRFRVRDAPAFNVEDSTGQRCTNRPVGYSKLSFSVGIRPRGLQARTSSHTDSYTYVKVPVNGITDTYQFTVPTSRDSMAIDIFDVKWDYTGWGYGSTGETMSAVWATDCFRVDMQFSTDYTPDLPGRKIN